MTLEEIKGRVKDEKEVEMVSSTSTFESLTTPKKMIITGLTYQKKVQRDRIWLLDRLDRIENICNFALKDGGIRDHKAVEVEDHMKFWLESLTPKPKDYPPMDDHKMFSDKPMFSGADKPKDK